MFKIIYMLTIHTLLMLNIMSEMLDDMAWKKCLITHFKPKHNNTLIHYNTYPFSFWTYYDSLQLNPLSHYNHYDP